MSKRASAAASTEDESLSDIKRRAIDTSGSLGSLYDGYRDQILGHLNIKQKKKRIPLGEKPHCEIIKGGTEESENLLRTIGIQDDLRLSILLNVVPRTDLTSLIDYPHSINDHTRILHYTYIHSEQKLSEDPKKIRNQFKSFVPQTDATHIISSVRWGIHFVVILQLPLESQMVQAIDNTLEKVRGFLLDDCDNNFTTLNTDDLDKLKKIISMKVYSNTPSLTRTASLDDICQKIHQFKINHIDHRPIDYRLRPTHILYAKTNTTANEFVPLDVSYIKKVEQHFRQLSTSIKYLELFNMKNKSSVLDKYFKEQLYDIYRGTLNVKKMYTEELDRFAELLIDWRHVQPHISQIEEAFSSEKQNILKNTIDELHQNLNLLEAKEELISNLQQLKFQYYYVPGHDLDQWINEKTVEQMLIKDDQLDRILCSNDTLNKIKEPKFIKLRDQLVEERKNNPNLRLIYADFSYSTYPLSTIIKLPISKVAANENTNQQSTASLQSTESLVNATPLSSPNDDIINILLLGESGVGKSTFINAFVNYLTHETLKDAETNKPVVLIPVSFIITTGNNFDEHIVKFGEPDNLNNEDFDHPGQSVTQHCRSYLFHLEQYGGKKLRIIDTPGFGDTRGLDQDDLNIQHILEYIHNFTHLNAVCFLLKPNVARLNSYFRTCLTQLFDFLGGNIHQNVTFCFTNSRCTFYSPGDTAPLLRAMLNSLSLGDVLFKKEHTFCFDSESFRYLVALQNAIEFDKHDKKEYETSWSSSVKESTRLLNYICNNLSAYQLRDQWKSNKHAQIQIIHMIRPLLETIRNNLRNIILFDKDPQKRTIKLCPKAIHSPTSVCLSCKRPSVHVANFWILCDTGNEGQKKSYKCVCATKQHVSIDYELEYELKDSPANHDKNEMIEKLSLLLNACIEFADFLRNTAHPSKVDLFLAGLTRMIEEEKQLCANKQNPLNLQLYDELEKLKNKYVSRMREMKPNQNNIELPVIYERIRITHAYPDIEEQITAMKKGQDNIMRQYEYEVPNGFIDTSDSSSTSF